LCIDSEGLSKALRLILCGPYEPFSCFIYIGLLNVIRNSPFVDERCLKQQLAIA